MNKIHYTKQALDYKSIIALLKGRGLVFKDETQAEKTLGLVSYFRLAAYLRPFEKDGDTHQFRYGATFEQGVALYEFDTKLRDLVFRTIQKIEIALRSKIIHHFSLLHGPFWFLEMSLCNSQRLFLQNLSAVERELERSKEDFIKDHFKKYDYPDFPPAWKTLELASLGTLSKLYFNCSDNKAKKRIAREFNIPQHDVLESWLTGISSLRNCCAHHGRMWNRVFPAMPQLNVPMRGAWIKTFPSISNRFYAIFSCLVYWLNAIDGSNTLKADFKSLLAEYPDVDPCAMGFPKDWEQEPLWK